MTDETAFPDVKPWPDNAPPPHHNEPPLEDRVTLDFEEALRRRGLDFRAAQVGESITKAPEIDSRETAGKAGDLIAAARAVTEEVKAERELLNRPLLTAQRALKAKADTILEPLELGVGVLRQRLDAFMNEQEPVHGDHGARVGSRTEWRFEIVDPAKLPLAIRRHPAVIEAMEKVIRGQVKGGARSIAGVRIWSVEKANIR